MSNYAVATNYTYNGEDRGRPAIISAIATSPSNMAVAAGNKYWRTYKSGVLREENCQTEIDHAVLAVGYG